MHVTALGTGRPHTFPPFCQSLAHSNCVASRPAYVLSLRTQLCSMMATVRKSPPVLSELSVAYRLVL